MKKIMKQKSTQKPTQKSSASYKMHQDLTPEAITKMLIDYSVATEKIYSHKDNTVSINTSNFSCLNDIIDHEILTPKVQKNGFLVLRLSPSLLPLVTDISMHNFLKITGDDNDHCQQQMVPSAYTYHNVKFPGNAGGPSGVLTEATELEKTISSSNNAPKKRRVISEVDDESEVRKRRKQNNELLSAREMPDRAVKSRNREYKKDGADLGKEINQDQEISFPVMLPLLFDDNGLSDYPKIIDGAFDDEIEHCPCGDCDVNKNSDIVIIPEKDTRSSLLHEAFRHSQRAKKMIDDFKKIMMHKNKSVSSSERLFDKDLTKFEAVLNHLTGVEYYSYYYMIYKEYLQVQTHDGEKSVDTYQYDMAVDKNFIDECIDGTAENGLNYPWSYLGLAASISSIKVEDLYRLNSVNLMIYGASKVWMFVSEENREKLERKANEFMNKYLSSQTFSMCTLQHKMTFLHPCLLDILGVPYKIFVQKPGDLVVTTTGAYHLGINLDVNLNYAKNIICSDYKLRMLRKIYNPRLDAHLCQVNCKQRRKDRTIFEQDYFFLRSFYQALLKDAKGISVLVEKYYDGCDRKKDKEFQTTERNLNKALEKRKEELEEELNTARVGVRKVLKTLLCDTVKFHTMRVVVPLYKSKIKYPPEHWYPNSNMNLCGPQEEVVFNEFPYMHILVEHPKYKGWDNVKSNCTKKEVINNGTTIRRTFTYYKHVVDYWSSVVQDEDFKKIGVDGRKGNHANEVQNAIKLKKYLDDIPEDQIDVAPTDYAKIVACGNLHLYEIDKQYFYFCKLCLLVDIDQTLDELKNLFKQQNKISTFAKFVSHELKKTRGMFSRYDYLRHHLRQYCNIYTCNQCTKLNPNNPDNKYKSKIILATHIRTVHQKHVIFCPLCNKIYKQPGKLRQHWNSASNACVFIELLIGSKKEVKTVKSKCSICDFEFNKIEEFKRHIGMSDNCRLKIVYNKPYNSILNLGLVPRDEEGQTSENESEENESKEMSDKEI